MSAFVRLFGAAVVVLVIGIAIVDSVRSDSMVPEADIVVLGDPVESADSAASSSVGNDADAQKEEYLAEVMVEIPKGSMNKYERDPERGVIKLDRVLHSSVFYPGDYGIVWNTLGGDGDPLDAVILVTEPNYPGIYLDARVLGVLHTVDGGDRDDKILGVPAGDIRFDHYREVSDMPQPLLDEIEEFFRTYKNLEGKTIELGGWEGADAAMAVIREARSAFAGSVR